MVIGKNGRNPAEVREELEKIRKTDGIYEIKDNWYGSIFLHAVIELLSNPTIFNRKILSEYHGHFNGIECYLDDISSFIEAKLRNAKEFKIYYLKMTKDDFHRVQNLVFDNIEINFCLYVGDVKYHPPIGNCETTWENGQSFVKLNITGSYYDIKGLAVHVSATAGHELGHAYDDIKRRENHAPSIAEKGKMCNYDNIIDMINFDNDDDNVEKYSFYEIQEVKKLGGFLYFVNKSEMNALITEAYAEMSRYKGTLKTLSQAFELLQQTDVWRIFVAKQQYVKDIENITNAKLQNLLISQLNSVLKREKAKNGGKMIKTYAQFIKCVSDMWKSAYKKYDVKLGKICYDIFLQKNDTVLKGGSHIGHTII